MYLNFHSMKAVDDCGALGWKAVVTHTMLTFSSGESSTIAGPLYNPIGSLYATYSTKAFDFVDLPCPPQNIMVRFVSSKLEHCERS